jgi:predicted transcriptional regulator
MAPDSSVFSNASVPSHASRRIPKDDVLHHARRDQIVALVRHEPGLSSLDIRRRLGLGNGVAIHHLVMLERHGFLTRLRIGRAQRWFIPGQVQRQDKLGIGMLRSPSARRVWETVRDHPGVSQTDVALRLNIIRPSAHSHLKRLERGGLVRRQQAGRRVRYYAAWTGPATVSAGTESSAVVTA